MKFFTLLLVIAVSYVLCGDVIVITDDSYENYFARKSDAITYYYNSKSLTDAEKEFLTDLTAIGPVGAVSCLTSPDPCYDHTVKKGDLPLFAINHDSKKRTKFTGDSTDFVAVKDWIKKTVLGVGYNFAEKSDLDQLNEGDWLVSFYAPWCGHCKKLAPTWTTLSVEQEGKVKLAKIDCTSDTFSEFCDQNDVTGYPTIKYFKDGEVYDTYSGDRSLDSLRNFLSAQNENDEL